MGNLEVKQNPFLYDTNIKQVKRPNTITNSIKTNSLERTVNQDTVSFSSTPKEKSEIRQEFEKVKSQQGKIGKAWDFVKNVFGSKTGSNKVEKLIKQAEKGEISQEEAKQAIENYKEGQKTCVDVVADMASGILAVGAFALAVPTGGASLAVGLGMATAVGAGVKVGIKAGDAKATGKEYNGKDLLYDVATGGINGLLAPVTNGLGNTVTKTIGQKLGLKIVQEGAEEVAEQAVKQGFKQAAKSAVLNQTLDVAGGTVGKRAVALGAGMALDGALGGASDNMVRAALNGENIIKAGIQGAVGGMVMAPIIGGGFRVAGKAGKALNNKITTKLVLPDGLKTKFTQGKVGDCALLSTIDGMMNNPQTAKNIKKAITKTIGGDYNVKIGDQVVKVAKSSLSDEMLSDTTGIRIFEQAYKQLTGDIDGGFAEVVAKQFGLNPVHIAKESISDELLDKLAKNQGDTVLSFGTLVDEAGQISEAGQRHYFTIKNIDPETKMVTLTSPVDTSVEIPMSYEQIKTTGISIDGGTTKAIELPTSARNADDIKFRGITTEKIDDIVDSLMDLDTTGELDEDTVRKLFDSILSGTDKTDEIARKKIEKIISDFIDDIDNYIFEDAENLNLVLEFIEKTHKIIGIENIDNFEVMSMLNSIMDGDEVIPSVSEGLMKNIGELLSENLGDIDSNSRIKIFKNLISSIGNETPDANAKNIIKQIERLKSQFEGEDLKRAIIEIYQNGIPEDKIVPKLRNLALSSQVYDIIDAQNVTRESFNEHLSDVIGELSKRGYTPEQIRDLIKYEYAGFLSRDFILNPNIELFADTIEQLGHLGETSILTQYTTGSGPFNDVLTVPVENLDDLPMPNIDFSEKHYSFGEAICNAKELDSILSGVKTARDMTVYRGEGFEVLNQFQLANGEVLGSAIEQAIKTKDETQLNAIIAELLGAEITHPHFLSTAYIEGGAKRFLKHDGGGILWKIDVPQGSQGLYMDPFNSINGKEAEILFNRNAKLLIKNVEVIGGIIKITADMLPRTTK